MNPLQPKRIPFRITSRRTTANGGPQQSVIPWWDKPPVTGFYPSTTTTSLIPDAWQPWWPTQKDTT